MNAFTVLYSAAHADFPDSEPLGGGKAVADYLVREWQRTRPFALEVLSPRSLAVVPDQPLADLGELGYARFCRRFQQAATAAILRHDPATCVVLSNDISEGPDFAALGAQGYRLVTIFHVDVVEYFTRFYLRDLIRPERLTRLRHYGWLPDVLRLVFEKQRDCIRHSCRIIVPSAPMKETLRRCYPGCPAERIAVVPWGHLGGSGDAPAADPDPSFRFADDEFVILTLSRLSREKGLERLLKAMTQLDPGRLRTAARSTNHRTPGHRSGAAPAIRLVICGAPAYMGGRQYARRLRRLAEKVAAVNIEFAGHVTGSAKQALLARADLFVSPSIHESYGLTIAEAQAAGCPVISHHHYGAAGEVIDCRQPRQLATAIARAVARGRPQKTLSPPAHVSATGQPTTAARVAELLGAVGTVVDIGACPTGAPA